MSNIRIREWSKRQFYDPEPVLREMSVISDAVALSDTPERIRRLRTAKLKSVREARDAFLFGYGMSSYLRRKVLVSPGETEDCDFVTSTVVDDTTHFSCVQLKEWAPADLGPTGSLDDLLARVREGPSTDASLLIRINRLTRLPLPSLANIQVPQSELWFIWSMSATGKRWCLLGDAKGSPTLHEFDYPSTDGTKGAS